MGEGRVRCGVRVAQTIQETLSATPRLDVVVRAIRDVAATLAQLRRDHGLSHRDVHPANLYYDQGVWAFRKECVRQEGPLSPWWWMGERCRPVVRTWVTGRDIHTEFDVLVSEAYLAERERYRQEEHRNVAGDDE